MSRYILQNDKSLDIVVGWDDPLGTFFVHVIQPGDDLKDIEDEFLVETGNGPAEVTEIEEVVTSLGDYATLPDDVKDFLLHDQANRRQPTAFQRNTFKSLTDLELP